jgi:hypothetical protein
MAQAVNQASGRLIGYGATTTLERAEATNPDDTYQGALIREAGMHRHATAALAARPEPQKWVGTLELALTFQPNSFTLVREQLQAIVVPSHPDAEATYLDQKAPDGMTLQFAFEAASADEADEIARLYAVRVVSQFSRYELSRSSSLPSSWRECWQPRGRATSDKVDYTK